MERIYRQKIIKKLNITHNAGIRLAIGTYRSSPTPSILNLAGISLFNIRRYQLELKYEIKLASTNKSLNLYPNLQKISSLLKSHRLEISHTILASIPTTLFWI